VLLVAALFTQVSFGPQRLAFAPVTVAFEQRGLDIAPEALHAAMHAVPSGCIVPEAPQQTCPIGQSPPKHVTEFAAVHVDVSRQESVGAAAGAGRTAQHICGAAQCS
jgi:hypothetical protein